eukprot:TRINITY_DN91936_c0_g1_i1.p1 TRINITY_DN91936_c0_g1~~TRINITY_DN91936_c0_g1_i1.p1  ORF type:complete len:499 (+),score=124.15 TRINITY_DN91936_c0_g1_i1:91-1587(+)
MPATPGPATTFTSLCILSVSFWKGYEWWEEGPEGAVGSLDANASDSSESSSASQFFAAVDSGSLASLGATSQHLLATMSAFGVGSATPSEAVTVASGGPAEIGSLADEKPSLQEGFASSVQAALEALPGFGPEEPLQKAANNAPATVEDDAGQSDWNLGNGLGWFALPVLLDILFAIMFARGGFASCRRLLSSRQRGTGDIGEASLVQQACPPGDDDDDALVETQRSNSEATGLETNAVATETQSRNIETAVTACAEQRSPLREKAVLHGALGEKAVEAFMAELVGDALNLKDGKTRRGAEGRSADMIAQAKGVVEEKTEASRLDASSPEPSSPTSARLQEPESEKEPSGQSAADSSEQESSAVLDKVSVQSALGKVDTPHAPTQQRMMERPPTTPKSGKKVFGRLAAAGFGANNAKPGDAKDEVATVAASTHSAPEASKADAAAADFMPIRLSPGKLLAATEQMHMDDDPDAAEDSGVVSTELRKILAMRRVYAEPE